MTNLVAREPRQSYSLLQQDAITQSISGRGPGIRISYRANGQRFSLTLEVHLASCRCQDQLVLADLPLHPREDSQRSAKPEREREKVRLSCVHICLCVCWVCLHTLSSGLARVFSTPHSCSRRLHILQNSTRYLMLC